MKKKTKRTFKKLFALVMVLALLISNYSPFLPILKAKADPVYEENHTMTFRLDNATVDVESGVITFTHDDRSVTATVTMSGDHTYTFETSGQNPELRFAYGDLNYLKITFATKDGITVDVNQQNIPINGNNELVLADIDWTDDAPHLQVSIANPNIPTDCTPGVDCPNDNPGENPGGYPYGVTTRNYADGNGESTIDLSVSGDIEYSEGGGYENGITFNINGLSYAMPVMKDEHGGSIRDEHDNLIPDETYLTENGVTYTETTGPAYERDEHGQIIEDENGDPVPVMDPDNPTQPMIVKNGYSITGDTIKYDYDTESNTVNFSFTMAPGTFMSRLTINNQVQDIPTTRQALEACYIDHYIEITVTVPKADHYDIDIEARYPTHEEEFLGNFLWDYNPKGYTGPDDKVLNATMTFVQAEYKGEVYNTPDELNAAGGVFIWRDAERKKKYTFDWEGVGEAQFPVGTEVTLRIIPDAGYQLIDFGINGGVFEPEDEIGTYTFTVEGGPFHLQATIAQVDDVVKTSAEKIKSGSIELAEGEESMAIGTARLDVDDIELTKEQISNFEEAAGDYEISNYIDISLYNTVFKGREEDSWDTEVKDLQKEATITLKLEDGVDGNDVVIVHEKHDGTYEIIPVTYDADAHTITFKTKSFSNYAIASRTVSDNKRNEKNAKTYDGIKVWASIFTISGLALSAEAIRRKKLAKSN